LSIFRIRAIKNPDFDGLWKDQGNEWGVTITQISIEHDGHKNPDLAPFCKVQDYSRN
jgi:hypothetical protein